MLLPRDILGTIIGYLPFNSQLKMRSLCKELDYKIINRDPIINKIKLLSQDISAFFSFTELNILDYYLSDYTKGLLFDIFTMIDNCIEIELLFDLLKIDQKLRQYNKYFTTKDRKIIKQNDEVFDHFSRTNVCYRRFNLKLSAVFYDKQWFKIVRDFLMAKKFIKITVKMKEELIDTISFGMEIESNYCEIRKDIYNCKRKYFNQDDRIIYYSNGTTG